MSVHLMALLATPPRHSARRMQQPTQAVLSPPFPVDGQTTQRLQAVLQTDWAYASDPHDELRATVAICTQECRARGMSAEATILTVKAFVRHTAFHYGDGGRGRGVYVVDRLLDSIVTWSIEEYFRV